MSTPPSSAGASTTALLVSTAVLSLITGYMFGVGSSLGLFGDSDSVTAQKRRLVAAKSTGDDDDAEDEEDEEELEEEESQEVVQHDAEEEQKMVLVVRTDLGMNKGTYFGLRALRTF
jgi:PTH2 family peptidyl-tRNA hydrolase